MAGQVIAVLPAHADTQRTAIITDQKAGVIRFVIDGKEQAVLANDGLHINGSIDYTGTITDGNRYSQPRGPAQETP